MMLTDVKLTVAACDDEHLEIMPADPVIPDPVIPVVDWENLQIVERQDDEGRIEMISEEQIWDLLGLRDEDESAKKKEEDNAKSGKICVPRQMEDNEGGAAVVTDSIPDEIVISYDKENPVMDLGSLYPTMDEFRMALRQFAIHNEFDLGTHKSDKKRFRGFCKSSEDCPWRIVGSRQDDNRSVKVLISTLFRL